jgi:hypothetical protein
VFCKTRTGFSIIFILLWGLRVRTCPNSTQCFIFPGQDNLKPIWREISSAVKHDRDAMNVLRFCLGFRNTHSECNCAGQTGRCTSPVTSQGSKYNHGLCECEQALNCVLGHWANVCVRARVCVWYAGMWNNLRVQVCSDVRYSAALCWKAIRLLPLLLL